MRFFSVFAVLVLATTVAARKGGKCPDNFCESTGDCVVKEGKPTCECHTFSVKLDGRNTTIDFFGDRCEENFFSCFISSVKRRCMMDPREDTQAIKLKISEGKFKTGCKQLIRAARCFKDSLTSCSHLAVHDKEQANRIKRTIQKMEQQQEDLKYCEYGKDTYGDSCCGRECRLYDPERLCQCNSGCRKHGDCCFNYKSLCRGKGTQKRGYIAPNQGGKCSVYASGPLKGIKHPRVLYKGIDDLKKVWGIVTHVGRAEEVIGTKVENDAELQALRKLKQKAAKKAEKEEKKIEEIEKKEKVKEMKEEVKERHEKQGKKEDVLTVEEEGLHDVMFDVRVDGAKKEEEVNELQHAFKEKKFRQLILEKKYDVCGNCSRKGCEDPCMHMCKCKAYPRAFCRVDTCVLEPCDSTLPCFARWYIVNKDNKRKRDEVTMACMNTPNNC